MEHSLPILHAEEPGQRARTCIWMDAGAVSFRLCDRGFDCEHCPFDAAMRGDPSAEPGPRACEQAAWRFPPDRLYTAGHCWLQIIRGPRVRAGLDVFAARLAGDVREVSGPGPGALVERGEELARIGVDGGELAIAAPLRARVFRRNASLDHAPGAVAAEPYEAGWLAELDLDRAADLDSLLNAESARLAAECDLHLLRREMAFRLIAGEARHAGDAGLIRCAARLLGPDPFMAIARRFLHDRGR